MSRLIIHILGTNGDLRWFIEGEEVSASTSSAKSLSEKSWSNFKGEVIVFVPTIDVYLTEAKLPRLSNAKLRKAIPYAVEDEITEDLKNCHFATFRVDGAGFTPIGVINKECMSAWLQLIPNSLKSKISIMTPEVLAMPWTTNTWSIAEIGDFAWVRTGQNTGFSIEKNNLMDLLIQYQQENHQIEAINLFTVPGSNLDCELIDHLKLTVVTKIQNEPWIVFLHKNLHQNSVLNLLQGEYQSNYTSSSTVRLQKIFFTMVAGWLIVFCLFGFIKYTILNFQAHRLNSELATIYHEIYPGEAATQSSKQRVESALAAVKKAKQQGVFIRLVAVASPVLINTHGLTIQSASYNNSQLEVKLEATDFQLLDKVAADLRAKGIFAEQTHQAKSGNVIQSTLVMKER
ncbi:MAG: hypothetical protein K2X50_02185 [Gammaproteobacteria bacterium]|nr:hypothetical protein [Gammaproteobacteria bacterium]